MDDLLSSINSLQIGYRLIGIAGFAVLTHVVVTLIRQFARKKLTVAPGKRYQKLHTIGTLATSIAVFTLYFLTIGFILREFGVSLTAYLASASVIGLAIGFGSQGVVQDVVTGLTFIFTDLVDVGDLVEISGQTGVVKAITMRFVELENAMGASVFIPNRTINNVINYPRGYIRCIVDINLRGDDNQKNAMETIATRLMQSMHQQFPGIFVYPPSIVGRFSFGESKQILRLKFRIWPQRQQPIESGFLAELLAELTKVDTEYKPWMVTISYEVEARIERPAQTWVWNRKNSPPR
ncbi:MAG: small-conductance mechanosensitive channel [Gammaproteobacteria bacterium]|jgi:small-conductance mechanosensitive channel